MHTEASRYTSLVCTLLYCSGHVPVNTWTQIVYTKNGATDAGTFYVNGKIVPNAYTSPSSFGISTNNTYAGYIGQRSDGTGENFTGSIDQVRIYNQYISMGTVKELYAEEAPAYGIAIK